MKFRKFFVRFDDDNCSVTFLKRGEVSAASASGLGAASGAASGATSAGGEIVVRVSTQPGEVSGCVNSRYFYPACEVGVKVPDEDLQLVKTWLGATSSTSALASETLVKRMTSAVLGAFKQYRERALLQNLVTSAFVVGYALRRMDGSHVRVSPFVKKLVNTRAPQLPANEISLTDNSLQTVMEIMNTPVSLEVDVEPFTLEESLAASVTHLDIYMGKPVDLLAGDEQVTAIRTAEIAGERRKIWFYQRLTEDIILSRLGATTDFRVVASIPIGEAMAGIKGMSLPGAGVSFGSWDKIGKLDSDVKPGDVEKPEEHYDYKRIVTASLDLGEMDAAKRVRGITARGVFSRPDMEMELLGSHHRDRWRVVGRCRGAHMRLLRGVGYRWWQVRVLMDAEGVLDGISFLL